MIATTTTNTNTSRRAHPAAVRAALHSRKSKHLCQIAESFNYGSTVSLQTGFSLTTSATSLPINGTVTVSTTVKNQGTVATSSGYVVGIYLSADAAITAADTLLGYRSAPARRTQGQV